MKNPESGCAFLEALVLLAAVVVLPLLILFFFGGKVDIATGKVLKMVRVQGACSGNGDCGSVQKPR